MPLSGFVLYFGAEVLACREECVGAALLWLITNVADLALSGSSAEWI
jgi:hypothetical protein